MKKMFLSALCFAVAASMLVGCRDILLYPFAQTPSVQESAEAIKVPDLAGTDVDSARTILTGKGLIPKVVEKESTEKEGTVLSTDPGAGESVEEDDSVMLYVSSGAAQKTSETSGAAQKTSETSGAAQKTSETSGASADTQSNHQDSQPEPAAAKAPIQSSGENDWKKGVFTLDGKTCQIGVDTPVTIAQKYGVSFDSKKFDLVINDRYYDHLFFYRNADGSYSTSYSSDADLVYFYFVNVSGSPKEFKNCTFYELIVESRKQDGDLPVSFDLGQGIAAGITESQALSILGTPDDDFEFTDDDDDEDKEYKEYKNDEDKIYMMTHTWYLDGSSLNGRLELTFNKAGNVCEIYYESKKF